MDYAVGLINIKNKTPGVEPGVFLWSRRARRRRIFDLQPPPF
jgi:hypothetical protein